MTTVRTCRKGSQLPPGAVPWLCPNCLLAQAADENPRPPSLWAPLLRAARSSLPERTRPSRSVLAVTSCWSGSAGRHEHRSIRLGKSAWPHRRVKDAASGALATKAQVLRFRTEAAAAAVCSIPHRRHHEIGLCEDRHYLVMDLSKPDPGGVGARGTVATPRAADICKRLQGHSLAHERGILHREPQALQTC